MMKLNILLLTSLLCYASYEYETGKIDMHGGQDDYGYGQEKRDFTKNISSMSNFLDNNSSKKK
mgnify:CR=1 FL=1